MIDEAPPEQSCAFSFKPKIVAVQLGAALLGRAETWVGRGDQFFLAARRSGTA